MVLDSVTSSPTLCRPTTGKSSSPAGLFLPLVYAYVVDCVSASPYAYSSSTHRFPDERKPIEATPLASLDSYCRPTAGKSAGLSTLVEDYFEALGYQPHSQEFCHRRGVFFQQNRAPSGWHLFRLWHYAALPPPRVATSLPLAARRPST